LFINNDNTNLSRIGVPCAWCYNYKRNLRMYRSKHHHFGTVNSRMHLSLQRKQTVMMLYFNNVFLKGALQ